MKIPLSQPDIGEREIELVTRALRSGRLSMGPFIEQFERDFADYVGRRHAVAVSSGTAALHLCIMALNIGAKDEVLTTPFTFVASANCLLYEQAMPSFIDIEPNMLNMDPAVIQKALERDYIIDHARSRVVNRLSGRTLRAILPVHVFGVPCDMAAILAIANEWGLDVIEDACEALGAEVGGRKVGALGRVAVFAFYPNKQITTGEGGMVVTDDDAVAELCRALRNQGRDQNASWLRHDYLGFNYRLSELHSALGVAQLERLEDFLDGRKRAAAAYVRYLSNLPQVALPPCPREMVRSWFAYVIQLKGPAGPALRNHLIEGLRLRGIACQAYFPCVHRQPYFEDIRLLPNRNLAYAEAASQRCIALPFFASMTETQVLEVCDAVREILAASSGSLAQPRMVALRRARGAA